MKRDKKGKSSRGMTLANGDFRYPGDIEMLPRFAALDLRKKKKIPPKGNDYCRCAPVGLKIYAASSSEKKRALQ